MRHMLGSSAATSNDLEQHFSPLLLPLFPRLPLDVAADLIDFRLPALMGERILVVVAAVADSVVVDVVISAAAVVVVAGLLGSKVSCLVLRVLNTSNESLES